LSQFNNAPNIQGHNSQGRYQMSQKIYVKGGMSAVCPWGYAYKDDSSPEELIIAL